MVEGSHLVEGGTALRPRGSAITVGLSRTKENASNISKKLGPINTGANEPTPPIPLKAGKRLTKQPSMVREDPEGEELEGEVIKAPLQEARQEEKSRSPQAGITSDAEAPKSPLLRPEQAKANGSAEHQRRNSLSPSRNAHFSSQPAQDSIRHEPPERSKSPTKSAMKQSPSRGHSPANGRSSSANRYGAIDVSDTLSVGSDDIPRSYPQKKRGARVSFDDDAVVVGSAAEAPSNANSPIMFSPQSKDPAKRSWFNDKADDTFNEDDDVIQPVPALPSFGSIRSRKEHNNNVAAPARPEAAGTRSIGASNDHAIGNIMAHDLATKQGIPHNEPLPPEVTSVEGSGYHSGSDDEVEEDIGQNGNVATTEPMPEPGPKKSEPIPMIAVLPATPALEGEADEQKQQLSMPGEFPDNDPFPWTVVAPTSIEPSPPEQSTSDAGIAEPPPKEVASQQQPGTPVVGQITQSILHPKRKDEDSDDSGDSIYSDAAEEAADFEGDGFGSINAIVDSPVTDVPQSAFATEKPDGPSRPSTEAKDSTQSNNVGDKDFSDVESPAPAIAPNEAIQRQTQPMSERLVTSTIQSPNAHTNGAARNAPPKPPVRTAERKSESRQMRRSMRDQDQVESRMTNRMEQSGKQRRRSTENSNTQSQQHSPTSLSSSFSPRTLGSTPENRVVGAPRGGRPVKAGMRRSMRESSPEFEVAPVLPKPREQARQPAREGMRRSMRESGDFEVAPALPKSRGQTNARPSSSMRDDPFISPNRGPDYRRSIPPVPPLPRQVSGDSDSSSSFKKARRRKNAGAGGYAMRRSMRSEAAEPSAPKSTRNENPSPAVRPKTPGSAGPKMRTTLRGAPPPKSGDPSPGFGARMRDTREKAKAPAATRPISRRFDDSSDEDEPAQRQSSRFADSSDEDEPASLHLAPVRGIPRTGNEADSTDLDDSDEEKSRRGAGTAAARGPQIRNNPVPAEDALNGLDVGRLQPSDIAALADRDQSADRKRKSWFSFRGSKRDSSRTGKSNTESVARMDTHLEHSEQESPRIPQPENDMPGKDDLRSNPASPLASPLASPRPAKLVRRHTPQRLASDSWPFPDSPTSTRSGARPKTSDGPRAMKPGFGAATMRPRPAARQVSTGTDVRASAVVTEKGEKKKRFPMLRKAFRLHD